VPALLSWWFLLDAEQAFQSFLFDRQAQGRAARTIQALGEGFSKWRAYGKDVNIAWDTAVWTSADVLGWYRWMADSGRWGPVTRATWSRHLHAFLVYCRDRQWTTFDPPKALREPRGERPALNRTQMEAVVRSAAASRCGPRNKALLLVAMATGIRLGELSHLRVDDVDWQNGLLRVRPETSKSRRLRYVPLGHQARQALYEYASFHRGPYPHPNLFLGETGEPLDRRGMQMVMRRVGKRAGLPKLYTHMLRHTFATQSLLSGVPLPYVQTVLGHQALSTTAIYLNQTQMQSAVAQMNWTPVDTLMSVRDNREHRSGVFKVGG
jgi:integrase/recombinase XerD